MLYYYYYLFTLSKSCLERVLKIDTNVKTDSILCLCSQQPATIIIISITNGAVEITHQHVLTR